MTLFTRFAKAAPLVLLISVAACGKGNKEDNAARTETERSAGEIAISDGWIRVAAPPQRTTGGFLTIRNQGTTADRIVGVASDVSTNTELHQSLKDEDGTMLMRKARTIEIPAGEDVALKPGSYHVMFIGLEDPIVEGETYEVILTFEEAGDKIVKLKARAAGE